MNTITMNDVDDPFEAKIVAMGENIHVKNVEIESNGRRSKITPNIVEIAMRSLRVELQSCKEYN